MSCQDCGGVMDRGGKAVFCSRCALARRRAAHRRYDRTPKGRATYRRWLASPRRKISQAAYNDAHPERMREYGRRYRARLGRGLGVVVRCAAAACPRSFVRRRFQGRRMFCDPCAIAYQGPARVSRRRPEEAAAA